VNGLKQRSHRTAMTPTAWDSRILTRAAVSAALAFALVVLVTAFTDEGGVPWGERLGRSIPVAPACAAIGTWSALASARARGEVLALASLGRSRVELAAAAAAGGALVAAAAAVAIAATPVDARVFFPRATPTPAWSWQTGAFVDRGQGLKVGADGAPVWIERDDAQPAPAAIPRHGRAAAALATATAGLSFPLLVGHGLLARRTRSPGRTRRVRDGESPPGPWTAWLACGAAMATCIVLFQAAAVRAAPAMLGVLPPGALLVFAARRYLLFP
jgi:hypothetical protein